MKRKRNTESKRIAGDSIRAAKKGAGAEETQRRPRPPRWAGSVVAVRRRRAATVRVVRIGIRAAAVGVLTRARGARLPAIVRSIGLGAPLLDRLPSGRRLPHAFHDPPDRRVGALQVRAIVALDRPRDRLRSPCYRLRAGVEAAPVVPRALGQGIAPADDGPIASAGGHA